MFGIVFFMAGVRYDNGGGWFVDGIFIFSCFFLGLVYVISYRSEFILGDEKIVVIVYRNMFGIKFIVVKHENGENWNTITTKGNYLYKNSYGDKHSSFVFSDLDLNKIYILLNEK